MNNIVLHEMKILLSVNSFKRKYIVSYEIDTINTESSIKNSNLAGNVTVQDLKFLK